MSKIKIVKKIVKIKDIKEIILQSWEYLKYIVFVVEVDKDW